MKPLAFMIALVALLLVAPAVEAYSTHYSYGSSYGSSYSYGGIWMGQTNERIHYAPPGSRYGYSSYGYRYSQYGYYGASYRPAQYGLYPHFRGYSSYGVPRYGWNGPQGYSVYAQPYWYNYYQYDGHVHRH